ncbi:MAG: helix-turn-helix domain-containing protein [Oleispira sp.]
MLCLKVLAKASITLLIQTHLHAKYHIGPSAAQLAKANEYLQRLRIQKACELLESTKKTFEVIAYDVGYEDVSACRKSFVKIIGLTPKEFRRRFV